MQAPPESLAECTAISSTRFPMVEAPLPAVEVVRDAGMSAFLSEFIRATRSFERRFTPFLECFIRETRTAKEQALLSTPLTMQSTTVERTADPADSQSASLIRLAAPTPTAADQKISTFLSGFIRETRASERKFTPLLSDFIRDTRTMHKQAATGALSAVPFPPVFPHQTIIEAGLVTCSKRDKLSTGHQFNNHASGYSAQADNEHIVSIIFSS